MGSEFSETPQQWFRLWFAQASELTCLLLQLRCWRAGLGGESSDLATFVIPA
jgi:hypothetical protein